MKPIETAWTSYREAVVPKDAPPIQLQESKRAFFGGAWALYALLMNDLDHSTDEDTPQDLGLMMKLDAELRGFRDQVLEGKE